MHLEVIPSLWRVLLTNYTAFFSSVLIFVFWEFVLAWPASWIAVVIFMRRTILSFMHCHKFHLVLDGAELVGPSGLTYARKGISLSQGISLTKSLGITIVADKSGNEIWFREGWHPKQEIQTLKKILIKSSSENPGSSAWSES